MQGIAIDLSKEVTGDLIEDDTTVRYL